MQGQDLRYIISACQIVHRDGKNPRAETCTDTTFADTRFDHLEESAQETILRGYLLIERILVGRQQLIGEIIVLIDQHIHFRQSMLTGVPQSFLKHLGGLFLAGELKILKQVPVMRYHDLHGRTIQIVEIPLQPFHVIGHHHLGKIIAHDHITIMLLRRVLPDPSPAEQFLEPVGLGTVVVTGQGRDKQAFPETTGTQEDWSLIVFQARNEIGLVHIVEIAFPHLYKIRYRIRNRYSCHKLSFF